MDKIDAIVYGETLDLAKVLFSGLTVCPQPIEIKKAITTIYETLHDLRSSGKPQ